ncbi:MAG TPA: hypothetical protein VGD65_12605 [Chryseosolibacter sp.]
MRLFLFLFFMCGYLIAPAQSQKVTLLEGDLSLLKGQTTIGVTFTYDSMLVETNTPEEQFVKTKKADLDQKQAGLGARWEKAWTEDRKWKLEPAFKNMFARTLKISTIGKSQYAFIFHTRRTVPGWNFGVALVQQESIIDGEAFLIDTSDPTKILAKLELTGMDGRGTIAQHAWETGDQIAKAYETAGRELAYFVKSNMKKKK